MQITFNPHDKKDLAIITAIVAKTGTVLTHGAPPESANARRHNYSAAQLLADWRKDKSPGYGKKLAAKYNIPLTTVYNVVSSHRRKGKPRLSHKQIHDELAGAIERGIDTPRKLSLYFNVSKPAISSIARRLIRANVIRTEGRTTLMRYIVN